MISPKVMTLDITLFLCYPETNLTVFFDFSVQSYAGALRIPFHIEAFGNNFETALVGRCRVLQHPALARGEFQDGNPQQRLAEVRYSEFRIRQADTHGDADSLVLDDAGILPEGE